ncbi:MAG: 5-guanidino-2-oxopentanoate decarboxylase [Pseudomonadota bacterium]
MTDARAVSASVSCGEKLVELLAAYGVDTVFGIPGNHTVQLYRGLENTPIRHISPRHEQGAAFMADGYARATGKPATCFLISGPGLGNAVTPMIQALADSVPMLVVTAVAATEQLGMGEGRLHEIPDQRQLARQCSRFSHTLMRPDELPKVLARAFAVFSCERPGPVHIEIPLDVITADASHVSGSPWPIPAPPVAAPEAIERIGQRLSAAERPALLVGGGAIKAADQVRALAERLDAPVVTTVNGKGLLPPDHELLVGGSPSLESVRQFLRDSDAVLAVGTEFGETDYDMLFLGPLGEFPWMARVDIDAAQLSRNQRADELVVGDALESVALLNARVTSREAGDGAMRCAAVREAISREEHFSRDMTRLFDTIQAALPGVCLVGDSTLPTYYAVWQYQAPAPRRYFHSATGGGTLGYAIPAAIGARRALGDHIPVAVLIGDGSSQFTFMELASAAQEGLPIIVLLWNNSGYQEIKRGMIASKIEPVGVDIAAPDFIGAAKALGCEAESVGSLKDLERALKDAGRRSVPTLVELTEEEFVGDAPGSWY